VYSAGGHENDAGKRMRTESDRPLEELDQHCSCHFYTVQAVWQIVYSLVLWKNLVTSSHSWRSWSLNFTAVCLESHQGVSVASTHPSSAPQDPGTML
jgi:hypothetical protein